MRCMAPETEQQCRNAAPSQKTTDTRPHSRVAHLKFPFWLFAPLPYLYSWYTRIAGLIWFVDLLTDLKTNFGQIFNGQRDIPSNINNIVHQSQIYMEYCNKYISQYVASLSRIIDWAFWGSKFICREDSLHHLSVTCLSRRRLVTDPGEAAAPTLATWTQILKAAFSQEGKSLADWYATMADKLRPSPPR